jgi:hypothetical protein
MKLLIKILKNFLKLFKSEVTSQELDIGQGLEYLKETSDSANKTWELFQYFRSEVQHEHSLLMGRVTWYITCQSFLLTVYAITYSNSKGPNWFSNLLLPSLAIIVSFLSYFMIQGATKTIDMWGKLRFKLVSDNSKLNPVLIPRWRSNAPKDDPIHLRALWFPQFISILFVVIWVLIAYLSWRFPWL